MSYIDGFVIAVPTANKQKFIDHARRRHEEDDGRPAHGSVHTRHPPMPFDGKRMIFGGFEQVVEVKA